MQSATWLRIAAGLAAFQTVGHTIGAVLAGPSSRRARPIILSLAAGFAAVTAISALYLVTAPIVVAAAITVCLGMAAASAKPA